MTVSEDDYVDLFLALCGGGGNLGVAASFEYRLHPVGPIVTGGLIAYPFSAAWDVLRFYRDVTASLPDDLMVLAGLLHAPDGSGTKLVGLVMCQCGPLDAGEIAAQPIKKFGSPAMDVIGPMPYCQVNAMLDLSQGWFSQGVLKIICSAPTKVTNAFCSLAA